MPTRTPDPAPRTTNPALRTTNPNAPRTTDSALDAESADKYDHSDHPTTHILREDVTPHSSAKLDDRVEERAAQRHSGEGAEVSARLRGTAAGTAGVDRAGDRKDAGKSTVRVVDGGTH